MKNHLHALEYVLERIGPQIPNVERELRLLKDPFQIVFFGRARVVRNKAINAGDSMAPPNEILRQM